MTFITFVVSIVILIEMTIWFPFCYTFRGLRSVVQCCGTNKKQTISADDICSLYGTVFILGTLIDMLLMENLSYRQTLSCVTAASTLTYVAKMLSGRQAYMVKHSLVGSLIVCCWVVFFYKNVITTSYVTVGWHWPTIFRGIQNGKTSGVDCRWKQVSW